MPSSKPIVIAHRGASGYLPEHSLAAKALAHAMGADFLEQDVVLTRDGVCIVLHDIHLETTSDVATRFPGRQRPDGRYYAIDFDLAEIRQLRIHERSKIDPSGAELAVYADRFPLNAGFFGIVTLAEEIDFIAGLDRSRGKKSGLYVELKSPLWHREQGYNLATAVLEVLTDTGYADRTDQVFLQCFDDQTLRHLRHTLATPLPLIQLLADNSWGEDSAVDYDYLQSPAGLDEVASYADGIGPWLRHIYSGKDRSGKAQLSTLVSDAQQRSLLVHPYTLRRDELPEGIVDFTELQHIFFNLAQVDGMFTDFPDLTRHFIDHKLERV